MCIPLPHASTYRAVLAGKGYSLRKDDSPLCIYQYHLSVAAPDSTAQNVGFKNLLVQKLYFSIAFFKRFCNEPLAGALAKFFTK